MTRVEKLPGEPIILVTEKGQVNLKYAARNMARAADMAQGIEGKYCLILDTRNSDAGFAETLQIAKAWREDQAAGSSPMFMIMVGSSNYARLLRDLLSQRHSHPTPLFDNLPDALECARLQFQDQQVMA
ncbi:MAG: hypothetical protein K8I60_19105 [Anaerolineae bacterium]|nr:hypothetical protein [Anaerolineae bacterium]